MKRMTIKQRVQAALRKEPVDQIPLISYGGMPPMGAEERSLRNRGLGYYGGASLMTTEQPNVRREMHEYTENGILHRRDTMRTPVGEVFSTSRPTEAYGTWWALDYYIKKPEDYRVVEFMVKDTIYRPSYDSYLKACEDLGEDGFIIAYAGMTPMMQMRYFLGVEQFSIDLLERPDLFFSLHEMIVKKDREIHPILAESPAEMIEYCGNHSPEIIGQQRFEQYMLPRYQEIAACLHAAGKLLNSHLDANMAPWKDLIAKTPLDVITAFTPAPDTDMSVADARAAWPDKVLWINFPSSVHLASAERIKEVTRQILREAAPGNGLIVGITENIPDFAWRTSLNAITDVLEEDARARA